MMIVLTPNDVRKAITEFLVKYNFAPANAMDSCSISFMNKRKGAGLVTTVVLSNESNGLRPTTAVCDDLSTPYPTGTVFTYDPAVADMVLSTKATPYIGGQVDIEEAIAASPEATSLFSTDEDTGTTALPGNQIPSLFTE